MEDAKKLLSTLVSDKYFSMRTKHMLAGVGSGWLAGLLTLCVAKPAALLAGGGIIILHVAKDYNVIKIDWHRIRKLLDDYIHLHIGTRQVHWSSHISNSIKKYPRFSSSFIGGFLLGMAM